MSAPGQVAHVGCGWRSIAPPRRRVCSCCRLRPFVLRRILQAHRCLVVVEHGSAARDRREVSTLFVVGKRRRADGE